VGLGRHGCASEELVIGAALLRADLRITVEVRADHDFHLDHRLDVMKVDKRDIFTVTHAQLARDLLNGKGRPLWAGVKSKSHADHSRSIEIGLHGPDQFLSSYFDLAELCGSKNSIWGQESEFGR
jgi:hypothetical protein